VGTAESIRNDAAATATAQTIQLHAQSTSVGIEAQLTATAAPVKAAAYKKTTEAKAQGEFVGIVILVITAAFCIPMLGFSLVRFGQAAARKADTVVVNPGQLAIVGQRWIVDGDSGSVRLLNDAREQLPGRTAVQITHAAAPALTDGGEWIDSVVVGSREVYHELPVGSEVEPTEGPDRLLGK
jgi:hypothetical protein